MTPRLSDHFTIFGLIFFCSSLFWELRDNRVMKNVQFLLLNRLGSHVSILIYRSWAIAGVRTPPCTVNGLLAQPFLSRFLISFSFVSVILDLIQRNMPIDAFSLQMTTNFVRFVFKILPAGHI